MKSQKQRNQAPRPFKSHADRWSGGNANGNFIPGAGPKPPVRKKSKDEASKQPPAPPPADQ